MYMFAREKVDANGRRLVGAAQVIGLFNMLESAFEGAGLEDDAMPRMPGDQFELQVLPLLFHTRRQILFKIIARRRELGRTYAQAPTLPTVSIQREGRGRGLTL